MCRAADMLKTIYPVHLYCAMNRHIKSVRAVDIVRAAAHSPHSSLRGNVCVYTRIYRMCNEPLDIYARV